jgi:hypothetical protein
VGNYTATNTGIFMYDAAGTETLRIFASDPNGQSNYNSENLYIGKEAGFSQSTDNVNAGYYNTGIGSIALHSNTRGTSNSAFGKGSLSSNTTGSFNTAIGRDALTSNIYGFANTANGGSALYYNTVGDYNTANGVYSLYLNAAGSYNSAFGYSSGYSLGSNGTSSGNLFLGYKSAYNQTKGDYNILLGYNNDFASTTGSNQLNIGNLIYGTNLGINGALSTGNIGIGTTTPSAKLAVTGTAGTNPFTVASSTGSTLFTILQNGNVGVGTANPENPFQISVNKIGATGFLATDDAAVYIKNTASSGQSIGIWSESNSTSTFGLGGNFVGSRRGSKSVAEYTGDVSYVEGSQSGALVLNGNVTDLDSSVSYPSFYSSDGFSHTASNIVGNWISPSVSAYGTAGSVSNVTNLYGVNINNPSFYNEPGTSINVTNKYGLYAGDGTKDGDNITITNNYGLYLENSVIGTNNYAIYSAGGKSYFAGNVGIGTTTPAYKLHVGDTSVSGVVARFENSTGYCDINPTTTSLTCTSDVNLKKNIVTLDASTTLANLTQLNAVTYNWKSEDNASSTHAGFIAQEVQPLFPDLVAIDANGTLSVSYGGFIPYIIQSIKSIVGTITSFKDSFTTKNLCVGEGTEKTCITREQLDTIIRQSGQQTNVQPVNIPSNSISNSQTETSTSTGSGDEVATTTEQVGGGMETASEQATTTSPSTDTTPDVILNDVPQNNQ